MSKSPKHGPLPYSSPQPPPVPQSFTAFAGARLQGNSPVPPPVFGGGVSMNNTAHVLVDTMHRTALVLDGIGRMMERMTANLEETNLPRQRVPNSRPPVNTNTDEQPVDTEPQHTEKRREGKRRTCHGWVAGFCKDESQCHLAHYLFPVVVNRAHRNGHQRQPCREWENGRCWWPTETCGFAHPEDQGNESTGNPPMSQRRDKIKAVSETERYYATPAYVCKGCKGAFRRIEDVQQHVQTSAPCMTDLKVDAGLADHDDDAGSDETVKQEPRTAKTTIAEEEDSSPTGADASSPSATD